MFAVTSFELEKSQLVATASDIFTNPSHPKCCLPSHLLDESTGNNWQKTYCSPVTYEHHWVQIDLINEYFIKKVYTIYTANIRT